MSLVLRNRVILGYHVRANSNAPATWMEFCDARGDIYYCDENTSLPLNATVLRVDIPSVVRYDHREARGILSAQDAYVLDLAPLDDSQRALLDE